MEPLWSPGVATGGNRREIDRRLKPSVGESDRCQVRGSAVRERAGLGGSAHSRDGAGAFLARVVVAPVARQRNSYRGSTERLTLAGCRCRLDRVQHAMARDRVFKGGAEVRSLAIVAGETRVRLRDVGARALRRRPPILLWHGNVLERGLRALAPADVQLPDLGLAAGCGELQVALAAVDLPEQVRAARDAAAIVDREGGAALEQSADGHLIIRVHRLALARPRNREDRSPHGHGG